MHFADPGLLGGAWSWRQAWSLALSIGIRPCTGAIAVLLFALSIGMFWAGVFATFAMAAGTALTVSALAVIAVGSREFASRLAGRESVWAIRIEQAAGIAGAALVLVIGASFFAASLISPAPL
jgi:ABC-type nickel/cobalt efflux system permease component RcnA